LFRSVTPGTGSRLTIVDHRETYGRHILRRALRSLDDVRLCLDLGCGDGDDLLVVRERFPGARTVGLDYGDEGREALREKGIEPLTLDIERQPLPFPDAAVDLIVANQILEHTKEVFWINHEIFRALAVGGCLYLGVPNVLSLHNRLLGIFGTHPTCAKMISAHVRVFSKRDTLLFYREIAGDCLSLEGFYGSQFYPLPGLLARPLAALFPSLAFSIFFLIRKTGEYRGEFLEWFSEAFLETNFYRGPGGPAP